MIAPSRYSRLRICPKCGSRDVVRSHRRGFRDFLLRLFFLRPYRCKGCSHRFVGYVFARRAEQTLNQAA